ncbi:MAG: hypothetical protein AAB445_03390 [Patescibacteria group bacterium]
MDIEAFRRLCINKNVSDKQVIAFIMEALRENKITDDNREKFLAILSTARHTIYTGVQRSQKRHARRRP